MHAQGPLQPWKSKHIAADSQRCVGGVNQTAARGSRPLRARMASIFSGNTEGHRRQVAPVNERRSAAASVAAFNLPTDYGADAGAENGAQRVGTSGRKRVA